MSHLLSSPLLGSWKMPKHSGLKEFVDQVISLIGRDQVKPTTECLRGVATYPKGDIKQGHYAMALSDLMNTHSDKEVTESLESFKLGEQIMKSQLTGEWPHQRLDWRSIGLRSSCLHQQHGNNFRELVAVPVTHWVCCIEMHGMSGLACTACVPSLFEGGSETEGCEGPVELYLWMSGTSPR